MGRRDECEPELQLRGSMRFVRDAGLGVLTALIMTTASSPRSLGSIAGPGIVFGPFGRVDCELQSALMTSCVAFHEHV